MKKGVIFTYDAILAIGIVILLFSGINLSVYAGETDGKTRAIMHFRSSDNVDMNYLEGGSGIDVPTSQNVNCTGVADYNSQDRVSAKVKKCVQLG